MHTYRVMCCTLNLACCVQCDAGGCLIELAQQLVVIMIGKQIINNVQEVAVPYVLIIYCYDTNYCVTSSVT